MHYAQDHLLDIARKQFEAEDKLSELFIAIANVTQEQARNLVSFYQRKKMVVFDLTNARLTVKHGAYLDADYIEHLAIHGAF